MFYTVLRVIATICLKIYFKKIFLTGLENITKNEPTIYICNHPSGFFEPCILACFLPKSLHYLVRGDLFSKPLLAWLLRTTHQIPIFRFKDGFSNLKRNNETIENCYQILKENKAILIFAEGSTEQVRWIRPLRKGTARIALGTMTIHDDIDIKIVPIGIHFTKPMESRSEVMIKIGNGIKLEHYKKQFPAAPAVTIKNLTDDLYPKLKEVGIHCDNEEIAGVFEKTIAVFENDRLFPLRPIVVRDSIFYDGEQQRAAVLNMNKSEANQALDTNLDTYKGLLKEVKSNDLAVSRNKFNPALSFLFLIGLPLFIFGYVLCIIPVSLGKALAGKFVKYKEFYSSVLVAATMAFSVIWILILCVVSIILFGVIGLSFLLLPLLGYYSIIYSEAFRQFLKSRNFKILSTDRKNELTQLRASIVNHFN